MTFLHGFSICFFSIVFSDRVAIIVRLREKLFIKIKVYNNYERFTVECFRFLLLLINEDTFLSCTRNSYFHFTRSIQKKRQRGRT